MRRELDKERLHQFMRELGRAARTPGRVYLTGGATAVDLGWRSSTKDVDLKLSDPEPGGVFEALPDLKDRLELNVEMASPMDFIPVLPGWEERSLHVGRFGKLDFFHLDLHAQALAKIERGHERDLSDVAAMIAAGHVETVRLAKLFEEIRPALIRFPGIDPDAFAEKVRLALERLAG